ncbi:NUDIX domain-containing protein [Clostridiaceae bacterium M8S5]|nr:NUDIX domain-containing protein [Clostridiaceae bacterium M8S5]
MEIWDVYDKNRNKTGKTIIKGETLVQGEFHLVSFGVIKNSNGQYIISKRSLNTSHPNTWEVTGGAVGHGESSYEGVLREIKEELGIDMKTKGDLVRTFFNIDPECSSIQDVWLFKEDIDVNTIIVQEEEVSEAKLADIDEIKQLFDNNEFLKGNPHVFECFDEIDLL